MNRHSVRIPRSFASGLANESENVLATLPLGELTALLRGVFNVAHPIVSDNLILNGAVESWRSAQALVPACIAKMLDVPPRAHLRFSRRNPERYLTHIIHAQLRQLG